MTDTSKTIPPATSGDPTAESRKQDHIALAFQSQIDRNDERFYYEPMLAAHPKALMPQLFLGKMLKTPLWISSMTGGTEQAGNINRNLAQACAEFGMGMGLGSCRSILTGNEYFEDFNLRPIIGPELPFYANLGIAQVEQLLADGSAELASSLVERLQADGLFIHVNPLQEWLQPEGDAINRPPLETIQEFLELTKLKVIVKEVGQGMGPLSLKALMQLPIAAIEFAAHGGTNFSKLELLRSSNEQQQAFDEVADQGHSAVEMTAFYNEQLEVLGDKALCREVIISGGIKSFVDGYYLTQKIKCNAVYGQGSAMLKRANESYDSLKAYVTDQAEGLKLAHAYLRVR